MFNKEHYEVVANAIKETVFYANNRFDAVGSHIAQMIVHDLISMFMCDNPGFNRKEFEELIFERGKIK